MTIVIPKGWIWAFFIISAHIIFFDIASSEVSWMYVTGVVTVIAYVIVILLILSLINM